MNPARPAILAVDGGNSKADVALVAADGSLLAAVRGPTISHQAVGLRRGLDALERTTEQALTSAGLDPATRPVAGLGIHALAGADLPGDVRSARGAAFASAASPTSLSSSTTPMPRCGPGATGRGAWPSSAARGSTGSGSARADDSRPVRGRRRVLPATGAAATTSRWRRSERRSGAATGEGPGRRWSVLVPAEFGYRRPGELDDRALHRSTRRARSSAATPAARVPGGRRWRRGGTPDRRRARR